MKSVQVLISTYNGALYLAQQLDSVLSQQGVELSLLIRDDGSTDGTLSILADYESRYANVKVIRGDNIGYKRSFMTLVYEAGEFDYYAFADQDDICLPNKLSSAITLLSKYDQSIPQMYYSNCTLVDDEEKRIGMLHADRKFIPQSKAQAIVQGFAHGCTMVFNQRSHAMINSTRISGDYAHDNWIPLLHIFLGESHYDDHSYIYYRQHSNNAFGGTSSLFSILKHRMKHYKADIGKTSALASELLAGYAELLLPEDVALLTQVANYRNRGRIRLLFNSVLKRNTWRGTFYIKLLIILSHL